MVGSVEDLCARLRRMAADFQIRPEESIREVAMAAALGVSRTPLREALNRLVAEGYMTFQPGAGFACRALTPDTILDLYEAREAIEVQAVRLACERAADADLDQVMLDLRDSGPRYRQSQDPLELLEMDEHFHLHLAALSGNEELVRLLDNLNGRIRYVRLVDIRRLGQDGDAPNRRLVQHQAIARAVMARDAAEAEAQMRDHIRMRGDRATEAVRQAYAQIYVKAG